MASNNREQVMKNKKTINAPTTQANVKKENKSIK